MLAISAIAVLVRIAFFSEKDNRKQKAEIRAGQCRAIL